MPNPTVVVALNMHRDDPKYEYYAELTAHQKIDRICHSIELICQELSDSHPEAMWVVIWREHGVSGVNPKFLTQKEKDYLKAEMHALSKKYPLLKPIYDSVMTERSLAESEKKLTAQKAKEPIPAKDKLPPISH